MGAEIEEGLYELDLDSPLPRIYTHGQKGVSHLRDKTIHDLGDFLTWVSVFAEDRRNSNVGIFQDSMAWYHRLGAYDQRDAQRMIRAVPGTTFVPKAYFPVEVFAGLQHFTQGRLLREPGLLDEVLLRAARAGHNYCDPGYKPQGRRKSCRSTVTRVGPLPSLDKAPSPSGKPNKSLPAS
jgi:hypothetical protein